MSPDGRYIKIANLSNEFQERIEKKVGENVDRDTLATAKVKFILLAEAIACGSTDDSPKYRDELIESYKKFGKEHYPIPKFQVENDVEKIKDAFGIGFAPGIDKQKGGLGE